MKVWIDQDLCTGDGLCEEIAPPCSPSSTTAWPTSSRATRCSASPAGAEGLADIPDGMLDAVVEAAEECPGECIFIEA